MTLMIDFFYSPTSRYSYLAASQLDRLSLDYDCRFNWLPVHSIGLMRAARGASPFDTGTAPAKQYEWGWRQQDAEAWAALYGIPFNEPHGRLTYDPDALALACVAATGLGAGEAFARGLFQAVFTADHRLFDQALTDSIAVQAGLDLAAFTAALAAPATAARKQAIVDDAVARGAFGVPSLLIDGKVFWGNDRIVLLRHHLARRAATGAK